MSTLSLFPDSPLSNGQANRLFSEDRAVHDWYRFVLSYPPHLVRDYLLRWDIGVTQRVLDPFCGTGTTTVECKKLGLPSVGIEANPTVHFAAQMKADWSPCPAGMLEFAGQVAKSAHEILMAWKEPLSTLPPEAMELLLGDSISPLPLHKTLILRECIEALADSPYLGHARLALAKTSVATASNLKFGPEVGVSSVKKHDADVIGGWMQNMREIASDLQAVSRCRDTEAKILLGDARDIAKLVEPASIDAVFTSPPYPNEKDYSRTTRLEMVLLGYAQNKKELQAIKRGLLRSNTRNVYKGDTDDTWVEGIPIVSEIAEEIERRRVVLGKTSGFERLYGRVTKLYFGGMARHLAALRPLLRPGARLGYVVGDQASYLRVMIRTGEILAQVAEQLGYRVIGIDRFRERFATATRELMREEVVVLEWRT